MKAIERKKPKEGSSLRKKSPTKEGISVEPAVVVIAFTETLVRESERTPKTRTIITVTAKINENKNVIAFIFKEKPDAIKKQTDEKQALMRL